MFLHLSVILFTVVGGLALGMGRYASGSGGVHPLVAPPGHTHPWTHIPGTHNPTLMLSCCVSLQLENTNEVHFYRFSIILSNASMVSTAVEVVLPTNDYKSHPHLIRPHTHRPTRRFPYSMKYHIGKEYLCLGMSLEWVFVAAIKFKLAGWKHIMNLNMQRFMTLSVWRLVCQCRQVPHVLDCYSLTLIYKIEKDIRLYKTKIYKHCSMGKHV